jgi:hypothetical protein
MRRAEDAVKKSHWQVGAPAALSARNISAGKK